MFIGKHTVKHVYNVNVQSKMVDFDETLLNLKPCNVNVSGAWIFIFDIIFE